VIEPAKLAELRGALDDQRENLRSADSAHSTAERARLLSVMKALRANQRWVNRALRKMELGTYGDCERCGNPISIERLEALPWAILCIDCAHLGEGR
jgi:DnaK suppressor protein